MGMIGDGSFLRGLFGGRRFENCKETEVPWQGGRIDPWRLETDKALDYAMLQPVSIQREAGTVRALAEWGRPMDGTVEQVNPLPYSYYAHPADGTHTGRPLSVGAEARTMAADAMTDVRTLWNRRR
jgi:hypothetical protein